MTAVEKRFVNTEAKGRGNFARVRGQLGALNRTALHRALELGCGIGTASAMLAREFPIEVVGADLDPAQIRLAKQRYGSIDRLEFRVEDAACLSFAPDSFDLIVAYYTLHHIPDWQDAVTEIARVLRPGGILLFHDFVFPRLLKPLRRFAGIYTANELRGAFEKNGLYPASATRSIGMVFPVIDLVLERR
jgi:ubiquinone/menaquinone biosynthesis C-methylase UbiE